MRAFETDINGSTKRCLKKSINKGKEMNNLCSKILLYNKSLYLPRITIISNTKTHLHFPNYCFLSPPPI